MEIERKFLLPVLPHIIRKGKKIRILQGYLCSEKDKEVRIRKINNKYYITYKRGKGLVRFEEEIGITKKQFYRLWPQTEGRQLMKMRYRVKYKKTIIEIDLYYGNLKGLIVAEVEFKDEEASKNYIVPAFFGREITEDINFTNRKLLSEGLPVELSSELTGYKICVLPVIKNKFNKRKYIIITSRRTGEWILPKGKIMKKGFDHETARMECLEEAGLEGEILPECFFIETKSGMYKIYRMNVDRLLDEWKEMQIRKRKVVTWNQLTKKLQDKRLVDNIKVLTGL